MESIFSITFKDFVLVASDTNSVRSFYVIQTDIPKMYQLNDHLLMAVCGEPGDAIAFAEYAQKNIALYKMRNGFDLSTKSAAHFIRNTLAESLRTRSPYQCNIILAGYDESGPQMYLLDYLGTMIKIPYGLHGYGGWFGYGTLDKYYRYDMNEQEAIDLLKRVAQQIQKRLVVSSPVFNVKMISKDGTKTLDNIVYDAKAIGVN